MKSLVKEIDTKMAKKIMMEAHYVLLRRENKRLLSANNLLYC